jgi:fucose 4-O-acetylase-like acetyltransferase
MNTNRLLFIDIARAICIVLVVIGHYVPDNSPNWYLILHNIIYSFHMPLFMFVSGYVYSAAKKPMEYKHFIFNKFKRLMVPYFFVSTAIIFIKLLTEKNMYVESPVSLSSLYEIFYLPSAGFFLWFIYALFLVFLIIPFVNTITKLNIFLIVSFVLLLLPVNFTNLFCLAQLKGNLFYFVLGYFICAKPKIKLMIDKIPAIVFLVLFVMIYVIELTDAIWLISSLRRLFLAVSGIFFIMSISMQIDKTRNSIRQFFLKLAPCSYTIYLFHTTAEGFAKSAFFKIPVENYLIADFSFIFKALLIVLAGIFVPIILHKIAASKSRLFSFLIGIKYLPKNKFSR